MSATLTAPGAASDAEAAPGGVPAAAVAPSLVPGVELIGEYQGSGYRNPPYLARRSDGQVIQLTRLLYLVAFHCDGRRDEADIAAAVSADYGRELGDGDVRFLIDEQLHPAGLVTGPQGQTPQVRKADPLLALTWRAGIVPEHVVNRIARAFQWLYLPPVLALVLGVFIAADLWLFAVHGITDPIRQAVSTPGRVLGSLGLVVLSAGFHEIGHAAACRYGGARPGRMGAGLYIAWPVFYTDVTDAYRLDKRGRLRTDLGGIYFNAIFIIALIGTSVLTSSPWLLAVVLAAHLEVARQLLPLLRLDGYYIVADATGVPDLFARIGGVLRSAVPWNDPAPEVEALKPWVRFTVTAWVAIVVPFLLFNLGLIVANLPEMVGATLSSLGEQWTTITSSASAVETVAATVGAVALALPLAGIVGMLVRIGRRVIRWAWERLPKPSADDDVELPPVPTTVDAGELGDVELVERLDGTYLAVVFGADGAVRTVEADDRSSLSDRLTRALMATAA